MPADDALRSGRRLAIVSVFVSATLALVHVGVGLAAGSLSVVAIGVEFAGDVLASSVVFVGLLVASRPPDRNHPYGHGRLETVAGLLVGLLLAVAGAGIVWQAVAHLGTAVQPPAWPAVAVLAVAVPTRAVMALLKLRLAGRLSSLSLRADGWNDLVDVLSGVVGFVAVLLAWSQPDRFAVADHYGAFIVGLIVVATGLRVVRAATLDLADTMPDPSMITAVSRVARTVPGVAAVEKQFARKTGFQYHIDLHVEVDPAMTVRESHRIAHDVQARILEEHAWVAGVLVHIEPAGGVPATRGTSGSDAPAANSPVDRARQG